MIRWIRSWFRRGCSGLAIAKALDNFDNIPVKEQLAMPKGVHELADAVEKHLGGRHGYMSKVQGRSEIENDQTLKELVQTSQGEQVSTEKLREAYEKTAIIEPSEIVQNEPKG